MINTKRPNTDDYTQVGFVEAKDTQGNYQNIDHIYDSEGNIVFQQGYLNEYDGADDFSIPAIGKPLIDYTIYGNTFQDGIPTPDNPIMPEGTGDRTRNLFDGDYTIAVMSVSGNTVTLNTASSGRTAIVKCEPNTTYTVKKYSASNRFIIAESDIKPVNGTAMSIIQNNSSISKYTFTTSSTTHYVGIYCSTSLEQVEPPLMLNLGSEALSYEPYGYKIPIMAGKYEFLDEPLRAIGNYKDTLDLSTGLLTRRVKELVLTGEENIFYGADYTRFRVSIADFETLGVRATPFYISHYIVVSDGRPLPDVPDNAAYSGALSDNHYIFIKTTNYTSVEDFKSYLASQYAAGTPVTIWYVLTEPTTETISIPSGLTGIIEGVGIQNGTPTPDMPIMPVGKGKRTSNLFDFEQLKNAPSGTIGSITFSHVLTLQLKANTYYTMVSNGTGSTISTPADLYRSVYFNSTTGESSVNKSNPVTVLTGSTGIVRIGFFSERTNAQQYLNGEAQLWINEGSSPLPYEPYGYKLDISSGRVNLFDQSDFSLLQATSTAYRYGTSLGVLSQGTYTFSATKSTGAQSIYLTAKLNGVYSQTTISSVPFSFTADGNSEYIIRTANNTGTTWEAEKYSDMMLNTGSTALPYEPYIEPTETNIYLGEVESTRRIRKLVLTGQERWQRTANGAYYLGTGVCPNDYLKTLDETIVVCTHYTAQKSVVGSSNVNNNCISFYGGSSLTYEMYIGARDIVDTETFKSYLQQQYSNGTPVIVWYVLAEPETSIVNEPLMEISDYADSVDFSQTGVEITTLKRPNTTVIDITTSLPPSEVYAKYRGSKTQKYDLFLAANGDSFEAKNGQSLYIGDDT